MRTLASSTTPIWAVLPASSAVSIMASVGTYRIVFANAVDSSIFVFNRDTFQVQRVPLAVTSVVALLATPEADLVVLQASRDSQRSIPELWLFDTTHPTLEPTPLHPALSINGQRAGEVILTKTHVLFIVTLAAGMSELWVHPFGSASRRLSRADDRVTHFSVDPRGVRVLFSSSISPYLSSACLIAPVGAPVAMGVLQVPADLILDAGTTYTINDTTRVEVVGVAYLAGALKVITSREGTIVFLRAGFISGSFSRLGTNLPRVGIPLSDHWMFCVCSVSPLLVLGTSPINACLVLHQSTRHMRPCLHLFSSYAPAPPQQLLFGLLLD